MSKRKRIKEDISIPEFEVASGKHVSFSRNISFAANICQFYIVKVEVKDVLPTSISWTSPKTFQDFKDLHQKVFEVINNK